MRIDNIPREVFTDILFRAKAINRESIDGRCPGRRTDYKNGDWVYGLLTRPHHSKYDFPAEMTNTDGISGIEVDYKTIGQYTGLTDINGNKIFEGDIVETMSIQEAYGTDKFYVRFVQGNFYVCHGGTVWTLRSCAESVKVVGNIYDNPEMISQDAH